MNEGAKKRKHCERKQTVFEKTEDDCVSEYEYWIAILRLDIKRISLWGHIMSLIKPLNEWETMFFFPNAASISLYKITLPWWIWYTLTILSHCKPAFPPSAGLKLDPRLIPLSIFLTGREPESKDFLPAWHFWLHHLSTTSSLFATRSFLRQIQFRMSTWCM